MQTVTLYLPEQVSVGELRADLEEIVDDYNGKKTTYFAFPLPYAVGLAQTYELPRKGTIITITNDLNIFSEKAPLLPGKFLYYNALILLLGFNEGTQEFQWIKQSFEYLNCRYRK